MSARVLFLVLFLVLLLFRHLSFAQAPQTSYREIDLAYQNPDAGNVDLAGTLTEPDSSGPFPAVLLIPGAGKMDRDETTAGQKPFRVLADYLTRRGIAVLRADKRGVHASMGKFEEVTTKGFANDAEAGVRYLQSRSDIDPKQIGLIGHGEGAIEAVMVANDIPSIAFVVMLEGTGVPGEEVLLEQTERAEKAAGNMSKDQIKADRRAGKMLYDMAREGKNVHEMRLALVDYESQLRIENDEDISLNHWRTRLDGLQSPWLRFFLTYDPAPPLTELRCPVLALNGAKDMQVIADQNAPAISRACARGQQRCERRSPAGTELSTATGSYRARL